MKLKYKLKFNSMRDLKEAVKLLEDIVKDRDFGRIKIKYNELEIEFSKRSIYDELRKRMRQ